MNFFQHFQLRILLIGLLPAALFIILGFTLIAFPNQHWKLTEWQHKLTGVATTGKPIGWDNRLLKVGILLFIVGLGFALYSIYQAATFKFFQ